MPFHSKTLFAISLFVLLGLTSCWEKATDKAANAIASKIQPNVSEDNVILNTDADRLLSSLLEYCPENENDVKTWTSDKNSNDYFHYSIAKKYDVCKTFDNNIKRKDYRDSLKPILLKNYKKELEKTNERTLLS